MHSMYNMAVFEFKHSENLVQCASLYSGGRDNYLQCSGSLYMHAPRPCACTCMCNVRQMFPIQNTCEYKSR
jgi:hypothetical protein